MVQNDGENDQRSLMWSLASQGLLFGKAVRFQEEPQYVRSRRSFWNVYYKCLCQKIACPNYFLWPWEGLRHRGSTWTTGVLVSGAISPGLFRASCPKVLSGLEWAAFGQGCTSRRWGSRKVASCLQPHSVPKSINIVNAVLKDMDCSLFVDDFFLCVQGKSLVK